MNKNENTLEDRVYSRKSRLDILANTRFFSEPQLESFGIMFSITVLVFADWIMVGVDEFFMAIQFACMAVIFRSILPAFVQSQLAAAAAGGRRR